MNRTEKLFLEMGRNNRWYRAQEPSFLSPQVPPRGKPYRSRKRVSIDEDEMREWYKKILDPARFVDN